MKRVFISIITFFCLTTVALAQNVLLLQPNGGVLAAGSTYQIQWTGKGAKYTLKFSRNNGMTWSTIASNITATSYDWTVPIPTNNIKKCLISVVAYNENNRVIGTDKSDAPFIIEVVRLNSPNGGETLYAGSNYEISWTANATITPVSNVSLLYTTNGVTWRSIDMGSDNTNDGSFIWTIPNVSTPITKAKVRIVLKDSSNKIIGSDDSDSVFTILPASQGDVKIIGGSNQ